MPMLFVPAEERAERVELSPDECIIDGRDFFLRGCVEIPVEGQSLPVIWGVWAQVAPDVFKAYRERADKAAAFIGRLPCVPPIYEDSEPAVEITPRLGIRPAFRVIPPDHPMAVHQRRGMTEGEVLSIAEELLHGKSRRVASPTLLTRLRQWVANLTGRAEKR